VLKLADYDAEPINGLQQVMGPVTLVVLVDIDDLPDARLDQEKKAGITWL